MDAVTSRIFKTVADLDGTPEGAYNFRINGGGGGRRSSEHIVITSKEEQPGIDIHIKPGTRDEVVHIPVVVSESGLSDLVYNDFYVGEDSDVLIVAGCGIHNDGDQTARHDGIHTFHVGKNAKVKYVEKHYGEGGGSGDRVLNPETVVYLEEGSHLEMETVQIEGVDSTKRVTRGKIGDDASLVIKEKLMTSGTQTAHTDFEIDLDGKGSSANVASRSVAKGSSYQEFRSVINGNNACAGHSECDAIIMDQGVVSAIPVVTANSVDAALIHEAAIGKIAGEQIIKLMSLGLSSEEAEQEIVTGFLR